MQHLKRSLAVSVFLALLAATASAATITYQDLGTAAPPAILGGHPMTPFGPDVVNPIGSPASTVASPLGGDLVLVPASTHYKIGSGWATWSNGYTGDVYFDAAGGSLTMILPSATTAFYFYAEPNLFGTFTFSATGTDGLVSASSGPVSITGASGARGFGFYTSDTTIASITVLDSGSSSGFAVGEFGIAQGPPIPEPASLSLLGIGLVALGRRRKAKK